MNPDSYKAIVPDTSPELLSWRLATGKDFRDEVWDGVYHVVGDKSPAQNDLENEIEMWLNTHWVCETGGRVFRETRLAKSTETDNRDGWDFDFRVPSLCIYQKLPPNAYVEQVLIEPPDVVIEVLDEEAIGTAKADFYRGLGVPEIWIFDSRNGVCEMICCENRRWVTTISNHEQPIVSDRIGVCIGVDSTSKEGSVLLDMPGGSLAATGGQQVWPRKAK